MEFTEAEVKGVLPLGARLAVPSAAIGEIDTGYINFVSNVDDLERGDVAGYNSSVRGKARLLIPRISRRDFNALQLTRLPEAEGCLESMLGAFRHLSDEAKRAFAARRKAVVQPLPGGGSRVVIVDRLPDGMDEAEMAAKGFPFPDVRGYLDPDALAGRRKKKKYSLTQVFSDMSVAEKYRISGRQMETAKRYAASNAVAAAKFLQDSMNLGQDDVDVKVVAGVYAKDKSQARNTLASVCFEYKETSAAVQADVIGGHLFMYGPEGDQSWHVSGPIKYAREVTYLYWMISVEGGRDVCMLFELEMAMLNLNYYDGATSTAPSMQYHTGYDGAPAPPVGVSETTAAVLTAAQRVELEKFADRLLPIVGVNGQQIATAVRVTDLHVLINSHVMDSDPACTIGGDRVVAHSQLLRDLWAVKCEGQAEAWSLREPVVGESVAVCYMAGGKVSCSAPVKVVSVDTTCVVTTLSDDVVARMSGGALVGLSDLALLGVHSGGTLANLISYRFGSSQLAELLDTMSESCFSRQDDVDSFALGISQHFKKRGLGSVFSAALQSLEPVYVGAEHVGTAVRNGQYLYTSCDAEFPLRFGLGRVAYQMETAEPGLFRTLVKAGGTSPVFRRSAVNFERVFVVGCDSEPYLSSGTTVTHVGPNGRSFVIGAIPGVDKPMQGGLVMGYDGAVLGVCGQLSATTATGLGYVCRPLPDVEASGGRDSSATLAICFPFLNMAAWPAHLLEEVFTHSSVGSYKSGRVFNAGNKPLACIGDNAAKAELYDALRQSAVPHPEWSLRMQALQSNAAFARVAWKVGFADCLQLGPGASMMPESKAYADLTEAVLGAAYIVERRGVFKQLCAEMGVLPGLPSRDLSALPALPASGPVTRVGTPVSGDVKVADGLQTPGLGEEAANVSEYAFGVSRRDTAVIVPGSPGRSFH